MFAIPRYNFMFVAMVLMLTFVAGAIFAVSMGMSMDMNGNMLPCPFMPDSSAVCPMSVATHIAEWQQLFTTLPSSLLVVSSLLFSIIIVAFSLFIKKLRLAPRIKYFLAKHHHTSLKVFAPLHVAYSRGVLNSRLYA